MGRNLLIEFIYFDLGNVILNFSHQRARDQLAALAGISTSLAQQVVFTNGLQDRYESGAIDCQEFAAEFNQASGRSLADTDVIAAVSDIFWLNQSIVPVISALKRSGIPLGILSNTCSGHWRQAVDMSAIIREYFAHYILSFESRSMKPDGKIYQDAISRTGLPPQRIFFTDDREENVAAARDHGIDACLFQSRRQLVHELYRRQIPFNQ